MQTANVIHSGGIGDLFYTLPACISFGAVNYYLNESKLLSKEAIDATIPFLLSQSYILTAEKYNGQRIDFDFDLFRQEGGLRHSPLSLVSLAIYQRFYNIANPWIERDTLEPKEASPIIINRTARYAGHVDYTTLLEKYRDKCSFIGTADEHKLFETLFGKVTYFPTKDFLEVAQVICGSKMFIGNQSAAFAIAEGLKHPRLVEVCQDAPNCTPIGKDGYSSWGYPDILELVERYIN